MADLDLFIQEICRIRNITDPEVTLGCDGDTEKCIVTCIVRDKNEKDDEVVENFKATGKNRVLTVAKVDGVPETRRNVELLLDSLNLPQVRENFKVVSDLKLVNIMSGIQSCTSMHSCPYCEGSKIDQSSGKPTTGRGRRAQDFQW